jgi:hypothetical protein
MEEEPADWRHTTKATEDYPVALWHRCRVRARSAVFRLANLPLCLALEVLGLALELLAAVTGDSADRVPELALSLFRRAIHFVLDSVAVKIVCHVAPRACEDLTFKGECLRWEEGQSTCPFCVPIR